MGDLIQGFNDLMEFINSGLYDFATELLAEFVLWTTTSLIKAKIFFITIAWGTASAILDNLNISAFITASWSAIPLETAQTLAFFRIPESINIILSASVTRFVLNVLGW